MTSHRTTRPKRLPGISLVLAAAVIVAALTVASPMAAFAHGPTVRLSHSGLRPPTLTIEVGTTVHFHNDSGSDLPCTVTALDGSFASPALAKADGWHYTFEREGIFEYKLAESSRAKGKIVVYTPR